MAGLLVRGMVPALVVTLALAAHASPREVVVRLPVTVTDGRSSVVVKPGDHLWKISVAHLHGELGRDPDDAEIWPYWRTVIEINTGRLRSGDPDLIYPGELIELP